MGTILLIVVLILLFGGGGGYYAHRNYGGTGLGGVLGLVVLVLISISSRIGPCRVVPRVAPEGGAVVRNGHTAVFYPLAFRFAGVCVLNCSNYLIQLVAEAFAAFGEACY